ncbi:restriction endonuclease subunit S [Cellulosimicrobium cellulans]|uniref:restriction endonuclease subunit S n=1 Tax=Cellulosimicrobium cellulans TaxID=1710 RepID=UPI00382C2725
MRSWQKVPLREIGTWYGGGTPSKSKPEFWDDGDIPWLSPKDMGRDVLRATQDHITQTAVENSAVRLVPADSVAIVVRSGILERSLPVARVPFETTLNQDMKAITPRDGVDPRWIAYGIRAFEHELLSTTRKAGTTVASIETSKLQAFELPVPPLAEQRRIVEVLEGHLSRLDAAELLLGRARTRSLTLLRSALIAGLRDAFVDEDQSEGIGRDLLPLTVSDFQRTPNDRVWETPASWVWTRIGDVFEVNVGSTPSRADKSLWDGDLPWVSSGEVAFGRIKETRERIVRSAAGNPSRRVHQPGTVMLAMIGEGKTRGQAAILDIEAAHNQNCASIRVSATAVLPEYVFGYLQERYFETRRAGSGAQQPALNKAAVSRFAIPIPPLATQRRLVAAWQTVRDSCDRLVREIDSSRARSIALRRALLTAAVSGRLTGMPSDIERVEELAEVGA